jgi:hypothetical protein
MDLLTRLVTVGFTGYCAGHFRTVHGFFCPANLREFDEERKL